MLKNADDGTEIVGGKLAATADAIKGVLEAAPVYPDAIQRGAKQLGTALETIGKTINLLLAPLSGMISGYEELKKEFLPLLGVKLVGKAKEKLIPPDWTIAGPTLESLRYAGAKQEIREMYVNLLAASMDKDTASSAHAAFVEVIRQLSGCSASRRSA